MIKIGFSTENSRLAKSTWKVGMIWNLRALNSNGAVDRVRQPHCPLDLPANAVNGPDVGLPNPI